MQSIFFPIRVLYEKNFCSLRRDGVKYLKSVKPGLNLLKILVLRDFKVEKIFFLYFYIEKTKTYHMIHDVI